MKRLTFISLTCVLLASFILAACSTATTAPTAGPTTPAVTKITVGTDATFPPFETVDETTKQPTGFDVELMNAIAAKSGIEVEWVNIGFDPLLAGLENCTYDVGIAAITISDERKAKMLFTDPYAPAGQIVSVQKSETAIKGKDDLKGKTIGAQLGTTGAMEAEKIEGATVKTYDSYDLAFLDLANGQLDAVIADYPTALAFVGKNSEKLMTVGDAFTEESYGIAVCKEKPELVTLFNDALKALKADGTIKALEDKWLATAAQ